MSAIDLIARRLRLRNPWHYKAPLLIALPYFIIGVGRVPRTTALLAIAASLCTIAGIAGVAYFLNDLTDARKDVLAGKDNAVAGMRTAQRTLILGLFLAAALGPWLYLPFTRVTATLLAIEFALFVVYCFQPFRLKERGVLGLVTDATYAHALPAVLAVLTFSYLASRPYDDLVAFLIALGAWQWALGVRNIALHQLQDYDSDLASGNRTLAVAWGRGRLGTMLARLIVPAEIITFAAFAVIMSLRMPLLVPAYMAFVGLTFARLRFLGQPQPAALRERLYVFADNFYADWLPLVILAHVVAAAPEYWPLAIIHLALFRNGLRQSVHDLKGRVVILREARGI